MTQASDTVEVPPRRKTAVVLWLLVGAGLLLLVVANAHLVTVAFTSQPGCVAHARPSGGTSGGDAGKSGFGAAQSSCTPSAPQAGGSPQR